MNIMLIYYVQLLLYVLRYSIGDIYYYYVICYSF